MWEFINNQENILYLSIVGTAVILIGMHTVFTLLDNHSNFLKAFLTITYDFYSDNRYLTNLRHTSEFELISVEKYLHEHPVPMLLTESKRDAWLSRFNRVFPEMEPYTKSLLKKRR
jgi:CO dehydrogenase/acetyl-CoA synthase epsilon subunit